jgi:hypothetical protein
VKDAEINCQQQQNEADEREIEPPVLKKWKELNHDQSFRRRRKLLFEVLAQKKKPFARLKLKPQKVLVVELCLPFSMTGCLRRHRADGTIEP